MKKRKTENSNSFTPSKRPYNLPSHLEPSTATQVHALEALLRNPIKFIPATHETTQGQFTMAAPSTKQIATKAWKDGVDAKAARQRDSVCNLPRSACKADCDTLAEVSLSNLGTLYRSRQWDELERLGQPWASVLS